MAKEPKLLPGRREMPRSAAPVAPAEAPSTPTGFKVSASFGSGFAAEPALPSRLVMSDENNQPLAEYLYDTDTLNLRPGVTAEDVLRLTLRKNLDRAREKYRANQGRPEA